MNQPTVRFLNRCFAPDETIALLLRRENPLSITQRVVGLGRALEPRYQAWLSYENGTGANVYVAANPLRPGTRKRTKESDVASAWRWLLEGIRNDDIITMLESRRRFEIPTAIAGARAREIAATAERMIARRRSA